MRPYVAARDAFRFFDRPLGEWLERGGEAAGGLPLYAVGRDLRTSVLAEEGGETARSRAMGNGVPRTHAERRLGPAG